MLQTMMHLHSAITGKVSTLVEIRIFNTGTGTPSRGNYCWQIKGRRGQLLKQGEIKNWARKSKTAAALLQRVLNDAYPKGVK